MWRDMVSLLCNLSSQFNVYPQGCFIDISNVFNTTDRALTLDVLSGRVSRDYACGLKKGRAEVL
jgi:hypothetical protein